MSRKTLPGLLMLLVISSAHAADNDQQYVKQTVDPLVLQLMQEHSIPGMAVGIVTPSGRYLFNYGVASKTLQTPVTNQTLFEIGSVSKTFTATLASYAQVKGDLSLQDSASKYLPELQGSSLDHVSLLQLATHTPGGMPLQFPDTVTNNKQMLAYFKAWSPSYAPATYRTFAYRTYANPSIGLLGLITAQAMGGDFTALMQGMLYPKLGLQSTYLELPDSKRQDYAQGYSKTDQPLRLTPGVLDAEAYGVRTTAHDLLRFLQANMGAVEVERDLQTAIDNTHRGYFQLGAMTQDLIWEQYAYPVTLQDLLAGNSSQVAYEPNAVTPITPPQPPQKNSWINKTGSTNGFGAYVAFVPEQQLGIVLLANKNYPVDARVTTALRILTTLANPQQMSQ